MSSRFWVIGGEYTDTAFERLVEGSGEVLGPYDSYDQARAVWQDRSVATRSQALMRFNIAREGRPG
jgi:hypothetical protein